MFMLNNNNNLNSSKNKIKTKKQKLSCSSPKKNKKIFLFLYILLSTFFFFIITYSAIITKSIPEIDSKAFSFELSSNVYDKDNNKIANIFKNENREWINFNEIPESVINAVIATEDKGFWKHEGLDVIGIIRAAFINIASGSIKEGGSTLTQQLAKNVLIEPKNRSSQKITRKIKEALIALKIEEQINKKNIIENYLNIINFGEHAYGIKSASKTYFSKNLKELSLEEIAMLAGIPQSPSDHNPIANFEKAVERKNVVLNRMMHEKYIIKEEYEKIKNKKIILNPTKTNKKKQYGYFIDMVINELENILKEKSLPSLYSDNYSIITTLDKNCQKIIEEEFEDSNNFPPDVNGEKAQGAIIVYDQKTGAIRAVSGGREYETLFGLNRALAKDRQPGSTFKPIAAYGPAIELGLTAEDEYMDGPININGYQPKNSGLKYQHKVNVKTAIKNSINTVAVQVLNDIGTEKGFEFAKKLGIILPVEDSEHLSLALGGVTTGVSVLEMCRAYGVFGNEGVIEKPHLISKIINNKGVIVYEFKKESKQIISPTVSWHITGLLQTVVDSGTGSQAKLPITMAGKTGTTELSGINNANKDLWFVGYTPNITACIWIGFDKANADNAFYEEYGGGYSARLWKKIMSRYLNLTQNNSFKCPEKLENITKKFYKKNILGIPKNKKQIKKKKIIVKVIKPSNNNYKEEEEEKTENNYDKDFFSENTAKE